MHSPSLPADADLVPATLSLVPGWAKTPFGASRWQTVGHRNGSLRRAWTEGGLCAIAASLPDAAALQRAAFEQGVLDTYIGVLGELLRGGYHPLRFWNFIPRINEAVAPGLTRYMVFNAARHAAYRAVHVAAAALPGAIATASGVGAPGDAFEVYCVGTRDRALPVENPRQVPAYEYSPKYGPLPPCFARAMLTRSPSPLLIIGGTASVRGERSVHAHSLSRQLEETLLNLHTLIGAACTARRLGPQRDTLGALISVRAYVVDARTGTGVRDAIAHACGLPAGEIELLVTELCRPDLLVEIEGVAALDRVAGVEQA
jgi:enamine deaminase RidA (YjgF/YER057c/UK114 family)